MAEPAQTSRSRRVRSWLTWLALLGILVLGAKLRLRWPLVPLSDSDTWGYLHPALSELIGQGFKHTYGRNFLYPGWVYLWLRWCGDFRAICLAQHLLGLGTGVLLWKVWEQWRAWFPDPHLPGWIATPVGLGLVAFYVSSTTVIFFEQRIRPEAIFPFFALLAIYLTLAFLRAWFLLRHTTMAAVWGGALVFDAILCYQLKPSFGLTIGVAMLPLAVATLQPQQTWRRRLILPQAAAVAVTLAALLLLWPEHVLAKPDEIDPVFLPETLLTIHARIIRDQMALDLAHGNPTPYPAAWLRTLHDRLDHELLLAAAPDQERYESLGFNPDYLMYQDSICRSLYQEIGTARLVRLCFYYYKRSWTQQPGAMLRKVGRQLGIFYGRECPAFWLGRAIDITRNYRKTLAAYAPPYCRTQMLAYPPSRTYLAQARSLTAAPASYRQGGLFTWANELAAEVHLPFLIAVAAGLALVLCLPSTEVHRQLGPSGALALLCFAYTFGNCLTIAIVHSLDLDRYSSNLVIFTILAEVTGLVWCVEALLCARFHLSHKRFVLASQDNATPQ